MLQATSGVIYLVESAAQRLVPQVAVGVDLSEFDPLSMEKDDDLVVEAALSRYHRVSSTIERAGVDDGESESLRLAVPLIVESRSLGVVLLHRMGKVDLSAVEEELP